MALGHAGALPVTPTRDQTGEADVIRIDEKRKLNSRRTSLALGCLRKSAPQSFVLRTHLQKALTGLERTVTYPPPIALTQS